MHRARFEHKLHATELSAAELSAVAAFLQLNVEEFAPLMRYDLPLKARSISSILHAAMRAAACANTAAQSHLHIPACQEFAL